MNIILIILSIYIISFRGLLSLIFGDNFLNFYYISAFLLLYLGYIGFNYSLNFSIRNSFFHKLKVILACNLIFMTIYALIEATFSSDTLSVVFSNLIILGVAPYSIFALINVSEKSINFYLIILTIFSSLTIFYDFIQLNGIVEGQFYSDAIIRYQNIRLGQEITPLTKSFNLYRPLGFMGYLPHNSALINCILAVYWFQYIFIEKYAYKFFIYVLFLLSFLSTILSLVASTIIVMLIGIFIAAAINFKNITKGKYLFILTTIILLIIFPEYNFDLADKIITGFYIRVDPDAGDWFNMLDLRSGNLVYDFLALIFGHHDLFDSRMGSIEVYIIGIFFQYSFFGALLLLSFLTYPILFSRHRVICINKNPALLVIFIATLSLWHYSSLFSTINITIFLIFYSLSISNKILYKKNE